jgi:hypothetical protein
LQVVPLEPAEVKRLARRHPEIQPDAPAVVVSGMSWNQFEPHPTSDYPFAGQAQAAGATSVRDTQTEYERLIDAMSPSSIPTPARVLQARWNAEARDRVLRKYGAVDAAEVGRLAGFRSVTNPSMPASRWQAAGKVFSVVHGGRQLFPLFQFGDDGRPLPIIARILQVFGPPGSGWQVAAWLTAPNMHLDGAVPIDVMHERPDDVVRAAAYAIQMPDF